jgi:hypothetical protein
MELSTSGCSTYLDIWKYMQQFTHKCLKANKAFPFKPQTNRKTFHIKVNQLWKSRDICECLKSLRRILYTHMLCYLSTTDRKQSNFQFKKVYLWCWLELTVIKVCKTWILWTSLLRFLLIHIREGWVSETRFIIGNEKKERESEKIK